jgi:hypothetical protein
LAALSALFLTASLSTAAATTTTAATTSSLLQLLHCFSSTLADESGEIESVFNAGGGKPVKCAENNGAGVAHTMEARHQQNDGVPEQTPTAQRNTTFDPVWKRTAQPVHRPHPQRCCYGAQAPQIVKEGYLERAHYVPCAGQKHIGAVGKSPPDLHLPWGLLIGRSLLVKPIAWIVQARCQSCGFVSVPYCLHARSLFWRFGR